MTKLQSIVSQLPDVKNDNVKLEKTSSATSHGMRRTGDGNTTFVQNVYNTYNVYNITPNEDKVEPPAQTKPVEQSIHKIKPRYSLWEYLTGSDYRRHCLDCGGTRYLSDTWFNHLTYTCKRCNKSITIRESLT